YIIRMHPNHDVKAERQLHASGVIAYVPKEQRKVKSSWNKRVVRQVPIFPGSLFVPDFEADIKRLRHKTARIGGFVRLGAEPVCISLLWMDKIRRFEEKLQGDRRRFTIGQAVRIISGPWELWEAKVKRLDKNYRLKVLVSALSGEIPITL